MKGTLSSLSDDDIRYVTTLIERLDRSSFDFLQLGAADMTLTLSKGAPPPLPSGVTAVAPVTSAAASNVRPDFAAAPSVPKRPDAVAPSAARTSPMQMAPQAGTVGIRAPLTGLFYSKPDPASPPFVTIGSAVGEDTTVCLIEVMKVFNAVPAGVVGVITEICAQDAEMIEMGHILFRVRPTGAEA